MVMPDAGFMRTKEKIPLPEMKVAGGVKENVLLEAEGTFTWLSTEGEDLGKIEKKLELAEQMEALSQGGTCRHDRLLYGRGKAGRTSGCDGRSSRKGRIHRPAAEIIWKMGGFSQ